jgi:hypothetical protein
MSEITVAEAYTKRHDIIANGGKFYIQKGDKSFVVTFRTDVQPQHSTDDPNDQANVHYRLFVHDKGQVAISLVGTKKIIVEYPPENP